MKIHLYFILSLLSLTAIAQTDSITPQQADTVVVNATRVNQSNVPVPAVTITAKELALKNLGQDLPMLLGNTPGVVTFSDAGAGVGYTGLRIRGSDATRINVTLNGIPINDAESHAVFWVNMPDLASSVNTIQIQRGVGSSTFGAGALGGNINILTNRFSDSAQVTLANSFGSFNTLKNTLSLSTGLLKNRFVVDARLSRITSDGYIERASSNLRSLYLSGGYYGNKTIVRANIIAGQERTYQAWLGVPEDSLATNRQFNPYTYPNQTDNYRQDHYQFFLTHFLNTHWVLNTALHYTRGRGYFEEFMVSDSYANYGLPNIIVGSDTLTTTNITRQRWLSNHFYGFTYSAIYSKNNFKLTLAGAANNYLGQHFGDIIWMQQAGNTPQNYRWYNNNATKTEATQFAKAEYNYKRFNFFADLQYRGVVYQFLGFDNNLNNTTQTIRLHFFNPKAGLAYNLGAGNTIYASVNVGNREPIRDDYINSTPTSRPLPEQVIDFEGGYTLQRSAFKLTANLYYMQYKNQLVLTGQVNDVGAYIRSNVANSFRRGIEIDVAYSPTKKLQFTGNIALSQNQAIDYIDYVDNFDTGTQDSIVLTRTTLSFSPAIVGFVGVDYQPIKGLTLSWQNKYVSRQYLDNTQTLSRSLNPFLVGDVRVNYNLAIGKWIDGIDFALALNNVYNTQYEPNGYTFTYILGGQRINNNFYYPQAGFNIQGGIVFKF